MKKRVLSLFLISLAVLTALFELLLLVQNVSFVKTLLPLCAVIGIGTALSFFVSVKLTEGIEKIDLDDVDADECDAELKPIMRKIVRQESLISRLMTELKHSKEEFKAIYENTAEGLIVTDQTGEITLYNSHAKALFDPNGTKNNVFALFEDNDFETCVKSALSGTAASIKLGIFDGVYKVFANPLKIDSEINGAVIIVHNVTEQEKMEVMRREFTSNVSHELKTPLTSIYGISEILTNGLVSDGDVPRFTKNIHDETGRLITLVNDIIKLSQMDENSIMEEKENVDLLAIAQNTVARLIPQANEKGVSIKAVGESASVFGIKGILEEMVFNLADNSIKYNVENGESQISVTRKNGKVILTVSDTGIGISPNHVGRIFERFYRVDKSHSKLVGGTGLGLSIVKHGAFYHGAEISVESTLGKGTVITVTFGEA